MSDTGNIGDREREAARLDIAFSTLGWIDYDFDGNWWSVTIEPSGSLWLPWPGRTSRWRYEISRTTEGEPFMTTYAFEAGGSGGAFTLRRCIRRASDAVFRLSMDKEET